MNKRALDQAKRSVVKVGGGRGFVIEGKWDRRMIVTTAHCLPSFPPCRSFSCAEERTYQDLLGPLNGPTAVWTECLFVDPISDLAVLGPPYSSILSGSTSQLAGNIDFIEISVLSATRKCHTDRWFH